MHDDFEMFRPGLTAPAAAAETITASDTEELEFTARAIYVGQGGDLHLTLKTGTTVLLRNIQSGVFYPLRVTHVLATGTTAADIVGLR